MAGETGSFSLAPSMIPPARRLFPSDATGSIRDSGSRHRGSNPRRGAMPIPLRNAQSLFSFRSEGHTKPRGQFLASMETRMACGVPSTVFPSYFPVAPEQPGRARERRPPSTVRKGTPTAITPTGVGDGLQNRAWLGSTPAIASHRIRARRIHAAVEPDSSP